LKATGTHSSWRVQEPGAEATRDGQENATALKAKMEAEMALLLLLILIP
jgi:hypothetical protein